MTKRKLGSEKVREGKAKIPLKIEDPDYANGEYPLEIKYLENDYYEGSDAFGSLWHVYKTFIHCPTIYVHRGIDENAKLIANLFSNNNLLNEGQGNFIVENVMLDTKRNVTNGSAFYDYSLKKYQETTAPYFLYGFNYDGIDEQYREPVRYDAARVIFVDDDSDKIPISIKTYPVMGAKGDTLKLIARVYKTINGGSIDAPKDIPDNGYLVWYVNNRYIGQTDFWESGYAILDYTIIENVGVYEYRVEYIPTNTKNYNKGYGANTLCVLPRSPNIVHATANIPTTSLGNTISFDIALDKIECIDGLRLYVDDQLVSIIGTTTTNNHTKTVDSNTVNVSFAIPETVSPSKRWAVEGTHAVFWEYTDTCTGITHYQWLDDMFIMFPSSIDFDYIGRNNENPFNERIFNSLSGIPIVTPEIIGNVINSKYPNKHVNDGFLVLDLEKLPTKTNQSITVEHISPTFNSDNYEVDDYININSTLLSNKDMGIPNRTLKFLTTNPQGTQTTANKITDANGYATNKVKLTQSGSWQIQTKYEGHKYEYSNNTSKKSITVVKKDTILELISNPGQIFVDDTVTYTFQLTCKNTPLSNQTIQISIGTKTYNVSTDPNGKATINHKHTIGGEISIAAIFDGTYKYNTSSTNNTVIVNKLDVTINIQNINTYVKDVTTIMGQISDQRGENVPGEVILKQDTNQINNLSIQNGTFTYQFTPASPGTTTYTIEYSATNRYNYSKATFKIIVNKKTVSIELVPATIPYAGDNGNKIGVNVFTTVYSEIQPVTSGKLNIYLRREKKSGNATTILVPNILVGSYDLTGNNLELKRKDLLLDELYDTMAEKNYLFYTGYTMTAEYIGNDEYLPCTQESDYGAVIIQSVEQKLYMKMLIDDNDSLDIQSLIPTITANDYDVRVASNNTGYPSNIFSDGKFDMDEIKQGQTIYLVLGALARQCPDELRSSTINHLADALVGGVNYDIHMKLDAKIHNDTTDMDIEAGEEFDGMGTIIGKSGLRYTQYSYWKFTIPSGKQWSQVNQVEFILIIGKNSGLFDAGEDYGLRFSLVYNIERKTVTIDSPNLLLFKKDSIMLPIKFTDEGELIETGTINYEINEAEE